MFSTCFGKYLVLGLALALMVPAAMAADLDGKWNFVFESDNGEHPRVIAMQTDGDKVTAKLGEEPLQGTCKDGKLELSGEHFAPEAGYSGAMKISGTVAGGEIKGTATWDRMPLTFTAAKAK